MLKERIRKCLLQEAVPLSRREAQRLQDILDAIPAIERYASQSRQAFDNQELIQI
jgi:uncharacterized protein with HEPN domain